MRSKVWADRFPVWLIKFWAPLVLLTGACGILTDGFQSLSHVTAGLLIESPFILCGIFMLSTAELRHKDHVWEYRRFLAWHKIPTVEIVSITPSLFPGLSYIRLNHFLLPWGKLYFITPLEGLASFPDIEAQHAGKPERTVGDSRTTQETDWKTERHNNLRICCLLCLAGILWGLVLSVWMPSLFSLGNWDKFPLWTAMPVRILLLCASWPWALITTALFAAQVFRQQFGRRSWASSFVVGILIVHMIIETSH